MEKSGFTRRQLCGVLGFALTFALLFLALDGLFHSDAEYSATWTRIRREKACRKCSSWAIRMRFVPSCPRC